MNGEKKVGWGTKKRRTFETAMEVKGPWGDSFTIDGGDRLDLGLMKVGYPPLFVLEPVTRRSGHLRIHSWKSNQRRHCDKQPWQLVSHGHWWVFCESLVGWVAQQRTAWSLFQKQPRPHGVPGENQ